MTGCQLFGSARLAVASSTWFVYCVDQMIRTFPWFLVKSKTGIG